MLPIGTLSIIILNFPCKAFLSMAYSIFKTKEYRNSHGLVPGFASLSICTLNNSPIPFLFRSREKKHSDTALDSPVTVLQPVSLLCTESHITYLIFLCVSVTWFYLHKQRPRKYSFKEFIAAFNSFQNHSRGAVIFWQC